MKVRVKKVGGHDLPSPKQETAGAAGFDLMSVEQHLLFPGEQRLISTGFIWRIPEGWFGLIRDRSGQAYKRRLTTRAGVIDPDYRGEVKVLLVNESENQITINTGDRIAQMVISTYLPGETLLVDDLDATERGEGGFGHTGSN